VAVARFAGDVARGAVFRSECAPARVSVPCGSCGGVPGLSAWAFPEGFVYAVCAGAGVPCGGVCVDGCVQSASAEVARLACLIAISRWHGVWGLLELLDGMSVPA